MPGRQHKSLRLFVAIDPPDDVRAALLRELRRTCDVSNARLTPPDQIHMTLQFIGETDERRLESVMESVERSASGLRRFQLTVQGLIQLPERGRPRLIAAETNAPADLLELHRRLAHRLARTARKDAANRFRPHLTLCRYRKNGRVHRWGGQSVQRRVGRRDQESSAGTVVEIDAGKWVVDRVRLMSSVLRPQGAVHREVVGFDLG